jgi:putative effector of murein hydrolase
MIAASPISGQIQTRSRAAGPPEPSGGKRKEAIMESMIQNSATIGVVISLLAYGFGSFLKKKTKLGIFNPLLVSIILVILFLLTFHIDYDSYNQSARYLSYLLTPATVALAIPLYRQMNLLKKNMKAILISVLAGF